MKFILLFVVLSLAFGLRLRKNLDKFEVGVTFNYASSGNDFGISVHTGII